MEEKHENYETRFMGRKSVIIGFQSNECKKATLFNNDTDRMNESVNEVK